MLLRCQRGSAACYMCYCYNSRIEQLTQWILNLKACASLPAAYAAVLALGLVVHLASCGPRALHYDSGFVVEEAKPKMEHLLEKVYATSYAMLAHFAVLPMFVMLRLPARDTSCWYHLMPTPEVVPLRRALR